MALKTNTKAKTKTWAQNKYVVIMFFFFYLVDKKPWKSTSIINSYHSIYRNRFFHRLLRCFRATIICSNCTYVILVYGLFNPFSIRNLVYCFTPRYIFINLFFSFLFILSLVWIKDSDFFL